jgi:hypothetical protein
VLLAVGPLNLGKINVIFTNHCFGALAHEQPVAQSSVGKQEAVVHILGPNHIRRIIGNPPGHFQQCVIVFISSNQRPRKLSVLLFEGFNPLQ